jgi:diguanylate cyclase (GGDEF)-like protein/PAS domain S-box-containing protein
MEPAASASRENLSNVQVTARQVGGRYPHLLTAIYLTSALFFLVLGAYEWQRVGENIDSIAEERGRVIFNLIELTRDWNARHGGVYVPVTETTQPNPYLEHPRRDVKTLDGRELTMINPAFMTRQFAELAEQASGVRFHITSLKPIRPANAADAWEKESLEIFEGGKQKERIEFFSAFEFNERMRPAHRYMAPLHIKPPCLKCHEKQGYKVGDIRGGISVTMPAEDLLAVRDQRRKGNIAMMSGGFALTTLLLHLLVGRVRRHYRELKTLSYAQEVTIVERTRELEERNSDLQEEIAERRRREHELRIAGTVFESAAEAIIVTDAKNNIVRVNPAFTVITGYTPKEVMGRNPSLLKSGRHNVAFYVELWGTLNERGHWEGEIWNRHKNGNIYVEWLSIAKIEDDQGVGQYLGVFHDITRRKEAEELLRYKANHDALTDVPNRLLFNDRLQAAFNQARRHHRIFALLVIDLDRFKEVNDTLGHSAGDQLLVEAARRLSSCVRESDTVARLGGDEFAIILTEMTAESEAEVIAQRAVGLLSEPYFLDAGTAHISGCVGIALYPQHGQDGEQLQRNADAAMYAAKDGGRNAYRIYSPQQRADKLQGDLL